MTRDRILSNVRMHITAATEMEVNRHLSTALTELNVIGFNRVKDMTVVYPGASDSLDPFARVEGQLYNYYPTLKCLVLPTDLNYLSSISINDLPIKRRSVDHYLTGYLGVGEYTLTELGEVYFGTELEEAQVVRISGKWSARSIDTIPYRYESFLLNHVLEGLYSNRPYFNEDLRRFFNARATKAWDLIKYSSIMPSDGWIEGDGIIA